MATRKPKEPVQEWNEFSCRLCADQPTIAAKDFPAHLREVHQLDTKKPYKKSMLQHLDADKWFQSDYEWKDGETVIAVQSTRLARRGSSLFMH
jgi:hypothetical protein